MSPRKRRTRYYVSGVRLVFLNREERELMAEADRLFREELERCIYL